MLLFAPSRKKGTESRQFDHSFSGGVGGLSEDSSLGDDGGFLFRVCGAASGNPAVNVYEMDWF